MKAKTWARTYIWRWLDSNDQNRKIHLIPNTVLFHILQVRLFRQWNSSLHEKLDSARKWQAKLVPTKLVLYLFGWFRETLDISTLLLVILVILAGFG